MKNIFTSNITKKKVKFELISKAVSNTIDGSGLVAQWIEHPPSKRVVAGSNPARSVYSSLGVEIL